MNNVSHTIYPVDVPAPEFQEDMFLFMDGAENCRRGSYSSPLARLDFDDKPSVLDYEGDIGETRVLGPIIWLYTMSGGMASGDVAFDDSVEVDEETGNIYRVDSDTKNRRLIANAFGSRYGGYVGFFGGDGITRDENGRIVVEPWFYGEFRAGDIYVNTDTGEVFLIRVDYEAGTRRYVCVNDMSVDDYEEKFDSEAIVIETSDKYDPGTVDSAVTSSMFNHPYTSNSCSPDSDFSERSVKGDVFVHDGKICLYVGGGTWETIREIPSGVRLFCGKPLAHFAKVVRVGDMYVSRDWTLSVFECTESGSGSPVWKRMEFSEPYSKFLSVSVDSLGFSAPTKNSFDGSATVHVSRGKQCWYDWMFPSTVWFNGDVSMKSVASLSHSGEFTSFMRWGSDRWKMRYLEAGDFTDSVSLFVIGEKATVSGGYEFSGATLLLSPLSTETSAKCNEWCGCGDYSSMDFGSTSEVKERKEYPFLRIDASVVVSGGTLEADAAGGVDTTYTVSSVHSDRGTLFDPYDGSSVFRESTYSGYVGTKVTNASVIMAIGSWPDAGWGQPGEYINSIDGYFMDADMKLSIRDGSDSEKEEESDEPA